MGHFLPRIRWARPASSVPPILPSGRAYLRLFPRVRLILCRREKGQWLAVAAHRGDRRFRIEGLVPLRLCQRRRAVRCRCGPAATVRISGSKRSIRPGTPRGRRTSGNRFCSSLNRTSSIDRASLPKSAVRMPSITAGIEEVRRLAAAELDQERLRQCVLEHAGAGLVDFLERPDGFRVTFMVGDEQFVSAVRKDDLTVQVAGICLSGHDDEFDLASLVGVIREGEQTGEIVPVGGVRTREWGKSNIGKCIRGTDESKNAGCWSGAAADGRVWHARRIDRTAGAPSQVEFDGAATVAREERRGDVIGFLHTHPGFAAVPSRRDVATMQAWVTRVRQAAVVSDSGGQGNQGLLFRRLPLEGRSPFWPSRNFRRGIIVGVNADGRKISSRRAVPRSRAS